MKEKTKKPILSLVVYSFLNVGNVTWAPTAVIKAMNKAIGDKPHKWMVVVDLKDGRSKGWNVDTTPNERQSLHFLKEVQEG